MAVQRLEKVSYGFSIAPNGTATLGSLKGGEMTRRIESLILIVLIFGASVIACAQSHSQTLVIENIGVADHLIVPMIIGNTDAGIASGRQIILQDIGSDFDMVRVHIISTHIFEKVIQPVQKAEDDGGKYLKEFGTLRFVILADGKIVRAIFLGREDGIKLLRSLEPIAGPGALQKSFTSLRNEVTTAVSGNRL